MPKTKDEETQTEAQGEAVSPTISLAFRVKATEDGLYCAEMLMLADDIVVDKRDTPGTTLGHAIGAADNLLDGWALNEVEQKPEDYFKQVFM